VVVLLFPMHLLVTAGNTQAPIDRVRCITNIFSGRTGAAIALRAWARGHTVTLFTSHPEVVADLHAGLPAGERWRLDPYRTFDDLRGLMAGRIAEGGFGAVVHCAAVSDYLAGGVFGAADGTAFDPATGRWTVRTTADLTAGKVKSDAPELWLRLVRAPKLIDSVRRDWDFGGVLVKFKLEVGVGDDSLLDVAERSRLQSDADLMVANTLDGAAEWAYLGPVAGRYERVARPALADRLLDAVEAMQEER
jgi:phosphopantothenoylcysteine synthetase/decarboxylase